MRRLLALLLILLVLSTGEGSLRDVTFALTPGDTDGDGLTDTKEDANGDGLVNAGETDPLNADSDRGGEADGAEVEAGRNPLEITDDITYDQDVDGLTNGAEGRLGTDPKQPDTDRDGILDGRDPFPLDPQLKKDTDRDGMPDEWEEKHALQPADSSDAQLDADQDGLQNLQEFVEGTLPTKPDTDRDGVVDGVEVVQGTDPEENPCLTYGPPAPPFPDTEGHWGKTAIARLQRITVVEGEHIVLGYPETGSVRVFLPDRPISRFELLKIALLGHCIVLARDVERLSRSFSDVPAVKRPHDTEDEILRRRVIYTALREGIIEGYADGSFRPDAPINRAEALKILLTSARLPEVVGSEEPLTLFPDVPADAWLTAPIEEALTYDLIEGYPDGTFRPEQSITRAEATKLLLLTMLENPRINGYVIPSEGL